MPARKLFGLLRIVADDPKSTTTAPGDTTTTLPADTTTTTTAATSDTTTSSNTETTSTTSSTTSASSTETTTSATDTDTTTTTSSETTTSTTSKSETTTSATTSDTSKSETTTSTPTTSTTSTTSTPSASVTHSAAPPITSTSQIIYTSGGVAYTSTQVVVVTPTISSDNSVASATSTPTPFLKNTAAVAGTFSAVGVVALILFFWAGTAFLRRRRAKRVEEEADAAAEEAYKTAADQRPYLDDEDDFSGGHGAYTDYSQETGNSIGQPPLVPSSGESYGMREMGGGAPYGQQRGYAPDAAAYGAAGLGAGLGANAALQRARSQKSGGSVSPYNAYAGNANAWEYGGQQDPYAAAYPIPNPQPYGQQQQQGYDAQQQQQQQHGYHNAPSPSQYSGGSGSPTDMLAAAGLEGNGNPNRMSSAAIAAQQRGLNLARSPSQAVTVQSVDGGLHRNKSMTLEQGMIPAASSAQIQYANPYADIYGGHDEDHRRTSLLDPASHTPPSPSTPADANRRQHYEAESPAAGLGYLDDDRASMEQPRMLRVANE